MALKTMAKDQRGELVEEFNPIDGMVILQPLAMRIPNRHGVYSPSRLRPKRKVTYQEFLERYADHPKKMLVCFDEVPSSHTLLERAKSVTVYGFGLDCWYTVDQVVDESTLTKFPSNLVIHHFQYTSG